MPKDEWGQKHRCECGAKFYDLRRKEIVCPVCGKVMEHAKTEPHEKEKAESVKESTAKDDADSPDVADDILDDSEISIDDDVLDDGEEDSVPLDDIKNVSTEDET